MYVGTRADFYVGRGKEAQWLGSVAMDGYPEGITDQATIADHPNESPVLVAKTEDMYRAQVTDFLVHQQRFATTPDMGWPWPWSDSGTTDYAYAFDNGQVWGSCFGGPWFPADELRPEGDGDQDRTKVEFPRMDTQSHARAGTFRSGVIVLHG